SPAGPRARAAAPPAARSPAPRGERADDRAALRGPRRSRASGPAGPGRSPCGRAARPAPPRRPAARMPPVALRPAFPSPPSPCPAEVAASRDVSRRTEIERPVEPPQPSLLGARGVPHLGGYRSEGGRSVGDPRNAKVWIVEWPAKAWGKNWQPNGSERGS